MSESLRVPLQKVRFGTLRVLAPPFEGLDALEKNFHLMEIDIIFNAGQFRGRSTLQPRVEVCTGEGSAISIESILGGA